MVKWVSRLVLMIQDLIMVLVLISIVVILVVKFITVLIRFLMWLLWLLLMIVCWIVSSSSIITFLSISVTSPVIVRWVPTTTPTPTPASASTIASTVTPTPTLTLALTAGPRTAVPTASTSWPPSVVRFDMIDYYIHHSICYDWLLY